MFMSVVELRGVGIDCCGDQFSTVKPGEVEGPDLAVAELGCACLLPKASSVSVLESGIADAGVDTDPASSPGFFILCSIW